MSMNEMMSCEASSLWADPSKNTVLFINDYYEEYGAAFNKLSKELQRPLRGVMLIDRTLKRNGQHIAAPAHLFEEVVVDFKNDAELRTAVKRLEDNLLLASCSSESSQMDFRRVLPHIPYLFGPSEKSLVWATHKGKMREVLGAYNPKLVPKVQAVMNASSTEIKKVTRALTFPMMIKPTGLSDSTLITKVHTEQELSEALARAFDVIHDTYRRERGNGDPGIIVEEFMEGDLYSIDGYVNETGKVWLLPLLRSKSAYHVGLKGFYIYQTETYHELSAMEEAAGHKAAEEAIHALGLRSTIAHIELYNTKTGWKIVELGARPGALRQEVYEVSYGVDHAFNELLVKIGLPPRINATSSIHSMVMKMYAGQEGVVTAIRGLGTARAYPSTYKMTPFIKAGDTVRPSVEGGSVMVQGVLAHTDVHQLRADVAAVRAMIKIYTKPLETIESALIDMQIANSAIATSVA